MQFRKVSTEEEPEIQLIPEIPVEPRLNQDELRESYGIGYTLLVKQGFSPGNPIGIRAGITEPLNVERRTNKSTLKEASQKRIRRSDWPFTELGDVITLALKYLHAHGGSASLRKLHSDLTSRGCRLPRLSEFRSLFTTKPGLFQVGVSDLIRVVKGTDSRCSCGRKFPNSTVWVSHVTNSLPDHEAYRRLFAALPGRLSCLACSCVCKDGLELLLHAYENHHSFACVFFKAMIGDAPFAPELLAACSGGYDWDWSAYLDSGDPVQEPNEVLEISDSEVEVIDSGFIELA